jgi:hypothetical protein
MVSKDAGFSSNYIKPSESCMKYLSLPEDRARGKATADLCVTSAGTPLVHARLLLRQNMLQVSSGQ